MDISSWTKLNPTVNIQQTKKKFYDQYLFKIMMFCPAGKVIYDTKRPVKLALQSRIERDQRFLNYAGSWRSSLTGFNIANDSDLEQLTYYYQVKSQNQDKIKIRIEEPYLNIYANDEKLLYRIAEMDPRVLSDPLKSVHRPLNAHARDLLEQGQIISTPRNAYKYKIVLRSEKIPVESRQQVLDYLDSLGDLVRLPQGCKSVLTHKNSWSQTYFYAMDDSILTFLNLISPGIVVGFYPMTSMPTK